MSNPNENQFQAISAANSDSEKPVLDISKVEPLPGADPQDSRIFWCGHELLPFDLADDFVKEEYYDGVDTDAIGKGKIAPFENVAPPLPKPFDPSLSVAPEIGPTQSLPPLRVTCSICRSTDKGIAPQPHSCRDFQT